MANFYAQYASPAQVSIGAQGTNGAPAPTVSLEVAGINTLGNLQPLQTDASGNLLVSVAAEPGAPIATNLTQVGGAAISEGQKTSAASLPVVIASDQSTLPVSAASLPLPTGASTSALQSNVQSAPGTPQTVAITVQGNASGVAVPVSAASLPLPTGAATSANQTNGTQQTQIVQGGNIAVVSAAGAQKVDGSAVTQPISAASLPLPTGASTAANQTNVQSAPGSSAATAITIQGSASGVAVPISGSVTASGTVTANQGTANATPWNQNISQYGGSSTTLGQKAMASSIPVAIASDQSAITVSQATAANLNATVVQATAANLNATVVQSTAANLKASVNLNDGSGSAVNKGQTTSAGSLPVVIASDQSAIATAQKGLAVGNAPVQNIYTTTSITTAAYTQLIASTTSATTFVDIFDSSGQAMILAVGAPGSEVIQAYVAPGGDSFYLAIPTGSRVAYKALSANAVSGYLLLNLRG